MARPIARDRHLRASQSEGIFRPRLCQSANSSPSTLLTCRRGGGGRKMPHVACGPKVTPLSTGPKRTGNHNTSPKSCPGWEFEQFALNIAILARVDMDPEWPVLVVVQESFWETRFWVPSEVAGAYLTLSTCCLLSVPSVLLSTSTKCFVCSIMSLTQTIQVLFQSHLRL